jgi:hypothetical protein
VSDKIKDEPQEHHEKFEQLTDEEQRQILEKYDP